MEEELSYVAVTFKAKTFSTHEKPTDMEIIYDEVKTVEQEQSLDKRPEETEKLRKARPCSALTWTVAGLVLVCAVLVSVVFVLVHSVKQQRRDNVKLTEEKLQLWTERAALERRTEELSRDRDRLTWTMGVILDYDSFPVSALCPDRVCKSCLDGWVLFQSKCYLFTKSEYHSGWKDWERSREDCSRRNADLVAIDSEEEQEFINNHTEEYRDKNHGYWIGLTKDTWGSWTWADGRNLTVTLMLVRVPVRNKSQTHKQITPRLHCLTF
ncbi:C-type lectin domain family 7 member A-like isoform X2 [Mugil cephalus]|uniref:C-type lectin domain family 7 member A-like isoform X2 n=1 Tax=Mugil cephalus TaxID=48193 RepID=UPI001FB83CDC|nr:C-type lectin domain family 7 member A-like isoform X2 [Mugil cephalus]